MNTRSNFPHDYLWGSVGLEMTLAWIANRIHRGGGTQVSNSWARERSRSSGIYCVKGEDQPLSHIVFQWGRYECAGGYDRQPQFPPLQMRR